MPTLNLLVGASTDDAHSYSDDSQYNDDSVVVYLYSSNVASARIHSGTRFLDVTIPQGATIISAAWQPYVAYANLDDVNAVLHCHDVDNSPTFAAANSPYDRITGSPALTTANVPWAEDSLGVGYASIDITACVQEVVNRLGWVSGNALTVLAIGQSVASKYVRFYAWDNGSNFCKLDIEYTTTAPAGGFAYIF